MTVSDATRAAFMIRMQLFTFWRNGDNSNDFSREYSTLM